MNRKKTKSEQKSQGAMEYMIIIAAVLIIAAVTTMLITRTTGRQREEVQIEECRSAAAQCSTEHARYEDPACEFCVNACEPVEENDLMENAVDCCKAGMEEKIYMDSEEDCS